MKNTPSTFIKPYSKEYFGVEMQSFYPYPKQELVKQPVFPFFILDGGAYNLLNDWFGKIDGDDLLKLTMSGEIFEKFKYKNEFNWESSFAYLEGTDFRKKYEWQLWPQRLYMTIPLAQEFLKTGDRKYADAWLKIVKNWDENHPYQPYDPSVRIFDTDMTWRDMQVGWRTLSLIHGIHMLLDAPFTKDEWAYIYSFVNLHVKHLWEEAENRLSIQYTGNHALQIGVVILYARAMFPEFENIDTMAKAGRGVIEFNMRNAVFADGGSNEDSPSYSHFIARLYLDAMLVIDGIGFDKIDGLEEYIKKQYELLYHTAAPDGTTLPLSDSYSLDAMKDIEYVSRFIDLDFDRTLDTVLFPDTKLAIFRKGVFTFVADGAPWPGPHHHAGVPQILLYHGKNPLIVDSGVCNYDRWEFYGHLHNFDAHNVVYNDSYDIYDCTVTPTIEKFDGDKGIIEFRTVLEHKNGEGYVWTRKIAVDEKSIVIEDCANSDVEMPWKSRLFFKRNDVLFPANNKKQMQLVTEDYLMTLGSEKDVKRVLCPVMNEKDELDYAVICESSCVGKSFTNKIVIEFEDR